MLLLPPSKDTCPICAVKHEDHYNFYGKRGRWPTWADATAHCTPEMILFWKEQLGQRWTEPEDGQPIADPPAESINQLIGDINSHEFGPERESNESPN